MEWYYAEGQQQRGPVTEAELENLVRAGAVKNDTLVWREGMANWQSYGDARGGAAAGASTATGILCSQCGRSFTPDQVIRYGEAWVCADCKPAFLQRLREGASTTAAGAAFVTPAELLARDYQVEVGGCLSRSWEMFKADAGLFIGATLLVYLLLFAINAIPYLSAILSLIFTGPLMGGLWMFYFKKVRGEDAGVGSAFGGFGPKFWQLALTNIVTGILSGLCLAPFGIALLIIFLTSFSAGLQGPPDLSAVSPAVWVVCGALLIAGVAGMLYLGVSWFFALPLVADKDLAFWPAMELSRRVVGKHWWMTLGLAILCGLLALVGLLLCLIGLLVTGPVATGMIAHHYQKVFGDLMPGAS